MTLMLSQLIDDLEGRVPRSRLTYTTEDGRRSPEMDTEIRLFIQDAKQAEKFDFGDIALEEQNPIVIVQSRPIWSTPEITEAEKDAWGAGLIPLPSTICWYEFILGGERTGLLLRQIDDNLFVQRVDYNPKLNRGVFCGCWIHKNDNMPNGGEYILSGPPNVIKMVNLLRQKTKAFNFASDFYFAIYLTLMLNSRTTEKSTHVPSAKLNQARERRGDEPLHVHRVVNLTPKRFLYSSLGKGTHSSPRLHWRRSHLRTFDHATPGSKFIEGRGWCTLIPRCLIGKEEVGTVDHEYKVRA